MSRTDLVRRSAAVVLATAAAALTFAEPASAAKTPPTPERVVWVADTSDCWTEPSTRAPRSALRPSVGMLLDSSIPAPGGPGVGGGDETWRYVVATRGGCWAPEAWTSTSFGGELDPSSWTKQATVGSHESLGVAGGVLARNDLLLFDAPSSAAREISETEEGDVLTVADWTVQGDATFTGRTEWRPVELAGTVAWMHAGSLVDLPEYTRADLTGTLTPQFAVTAYAAPSTHASPLGSLAVGEEVAALPAEPLLGFVAVEHDGQVGWVDQAALVASPSPSASPSATPTGSLKQTWEDLKAKVTVVPSPKTDDARPGFWSRMSDRFDEHNPIAKAAATTRLWTSGALAGLALLLLLLGPLMGAAGVLVPGAAVLTRLTLPIAAVVGGVAAWVAPTTYYVPHVAFGAAVLGLALAASVSTRIAAMRGRNLRELAAAVADRAWPIIGSIAAPGLAPWLIGIPIALAVLLALVFAGGTAALLARPVAPIAKDESAPALSKEGSR